VPLQTVEPELCLDGHAAKVLEALTAAGYRPSIFTQVRSLLTGVCRGRCAGAAGGSAGGGGYTAPEM
jgi:hypothetical protein